MKFLKPLAAAILATAAVSSFAAPITYRFEGFVQDFNVDYEANPHVPGGIVSGTYLVDELPGGAGYWITDWSFKVGTVEYRPNSSLEMGSGLRINPQWPYLAHSVGEMASYRPEAGTAGVVGEVIIGLAWYSGRLQVGQTDPLEVPTTGSFDYNYNSWSCHVNAAGEPDPLTCVSTVIGIWSTITSWTRVDDVPVEVPEPGSLALIGLGLAGATAARRRKTS